MVSANGPDGTDINRRHPAKQIRKRLQRLGHVTFWLIGYLDD
jgi:hypothetical protein